MPQLTTFLTHSGIPEQAIIWVFMLPIAITLVVIGRQIIGIKGLGIASPILIGYALVAAGIQAGTIVFLVALGSGLIFRSLLSRVRLMYLPKMALILLGVTIASIVLIPFLPYRDGLEFPQAVFSFLVFILVMEQFASLLIERGARKTFGMALETLAVSVATFFLLSWGWLQDIVVSYPAFVIGIVILCNFILGKWTGLRLSEYIRFKDIISR